MFNNLKDIHESRLKESGWIKDRSRYWPID